MDGVTPLRSRNSSAGLQPRLQSAAQFLDGYVAPEFLVDDVIQRGRLYSCTGQTGSGKTAVTLLASICIAAGRQFAGRRVEQGAVAFFAGENPDDVRGRVIMTGAALGIDPRSLPLYFFEGPFDLVGAADTIRQEVQQVGPLALVNVDTAAAFFRGDDENSNVLLGNYARDLRRLTQLPGKPCVLVNSHPVKGAQSKEQMLPRGGGAFLAEVDGNLCICSRDKTATELHWTGKIRGPDFEPMTFRLEESTSDLVLDARGRRVPSVVAVPLSDDAADEQRRAVRSDEDGLLDMLLNWPAASIADNAKRLGWVSATGEPQKSKVHRLLNRLKEDRLVDQRRGRWTLTAAGRKEAERVI